MAYAASQRWPHCRIHAVEPNARSRRLANNILDSASESIDGDAADVDLAIIATPTALAQEVLENLAQQRRALKLPTKLLVTDVCGVKKQIEEWAAINDDVLEFLGAHPMAGGSQGGFDFARGNLFENASVAICPQPNSTAAALQTVESMWQQFGAVVEKMSSEEHDAEVALTSHLPYLASIGQVLCLMEQTQSPRLLGRGFTYAARQAEFDPKVMLSVARRNPSLIPALRNLATILNGFADSLEGDENAIAERAEQAREYRMRVVKTRL